MIYPLHTFLHRLLVDKLFTLYTYACMRARVHVCMYVCMYVRAGYQSIFFKMIDIRLSFDIFSNIKLTCHSLIWHQLWCMIVASIGHLQMDIWSHLELNYKAGLLHLHQIAGMAGCILTTSDFRQPAVYLVTAIRSTPVSCLVIIKYRSMWSYMNTVEKFI